MTEAAARARIMELRIDAYVCRWKVTRREAATWLRWMDDARKRGHVFAEDVTL
jgi:hypothetical protein